jgi:hypothetical protein
VPKLRSLAALISILQLIGLFWAPGRACAQSDAALADRFKPYIKSSLGPDSAADPFLPLRWQSFVQHSTLMNGKTTLVTEDQWDGGFTELTTKGADLTVNPTPTGFTLNYDMHGGRDWPFVFMGDGVYAHVERVGLPPQGEDDRLVNIDYSIIWSNNADAAGANNHLGDITFIVVLYDPKSDRIVRLTYPAHGCILQIYQMQPTQMVSIARLDGRGPDGSNDAPKVQAFATQTDIDQANEDDETDSPCNGGAFLSSGMHVFFVQDPLTKRFEHPAIFAENQTHESFPNAEKGSITDGGGHDGLGPSWLPASITLLPSFAVTDDPNTPFLHYNGKFGTDSASLALHRTWCWATIDPRTPCAYANPNPSWPAITTGFSDMMPYQQRRQLAWPQVVDLPPTGDAFVVPQRTTGNGSQQAPYGGLDVAGTFTPKGWTLHLAPGTYGAVRLERALTLQADTGPVTITAQGN